MKKLAVILTVVGSCIISTQTKAQMTQGDFTFGAGLHLGLPLGDFHQTHSFGIGGQVQGEYAFTENISGALTTGYTSFFGKTIDYTVAGATYSTKLSSVGLIPIIVGPRFYPTEKIFVGVQAGLGILTGSGSSTSAFDYNPQIGYNAESFQAILGYNGLSKDGSTLSHLGLTFLYKFGGGK